ncbi:MAG: hypothetical protein U0X39_07595 [Bacteroidales bacterium]
MSFLTLFSQTSVGSGQTYTSLRTAFNAINNGTLKGNVVLRITSDITETSSAVLNATGTGGSSYSSVTIYPAAADILITGSFNSPLIDFNGATNVTINGRINNTGTALNLTINNTSTSSSTWNSTIRFRNSSSNITISNCIIEGSTTSTTGGILFFSTSTSGTGNDNITISSNNISGNSANRPVYAIFSSGTAARENSSIIISGNNIFDHLRPASTSYGIFVSTNSTLFTITDNNFYETASFVSSSTAEYDIIRISNTSGGGYIVNNNRIGGNSATAGSGRFVKTNSRSNVFYGIYIEVGTTVATQANNNTIGDITWANSGASSFTAIHIQAGLVNVGTTSGNTIGSSDSGGSIIVTGGAAGQVFYGINITSTSAVTVNNNLIGGDN